MLFMFLVQSCVFSLKSSFQLQSLLYCLICKNSKKEGAKIVFYYKFAKTFSKHFELDQFDYYFRFSFTLIRLNSMIKERLFNSVNL